MAWTLIQAQAWRVLLRTGVPGGSEAYQIPCKMTQIQACVKKSRVLTHCTDENHDVWILHSTEYMHLLMNGTCSSQLPVVLLNSTREIFFESVAQDSKAQST